MSDYLDTNGLQRVWGKFKENISSYKEIENVDIASFDDGSNLPLKSLKVAIEPQQDLHGYDNPWVGGSGKNKLQVTKSDDTDYGITTVNNNGTVTMSGTCTGAPYNIRFGESTYTKSKNLKLMRFGTAEFNFRVIVRLYNSNTLIYTTPEVWTYKNNQYTHDFNSYEYDRIEVRILISNGTTASGTVQLLLYDALETDPTTFEPYSNICQISGWSEANVSVWGKNLLNPIIQKYSTPFVVYGGTIASNTPDGSLVLKAGTYTISVNKNIYTIDVRDNPNSTIATGQGNILTFTLDAEKAIKIAFNKGNEDIESLTFQLEKGSTATTYEPYNGQTITIDLGGTRYGGTLDVVNGNGTDNCDSVTIDGTASWSKAAQGQRAVFRIDNIIANDHASHANTYTSGKWLSNWAEVENSASSLANYTEQQADKWIIRGQGADSKNFFVATPVGQSEMTLEDFKAMLNATPIQIVYPLATPTTYDTQPTIIKSLQGDNNLFASTGEIIKVEYQPDNIVGELRSEIQSLDYDIFIVNCINNNGSWVTDVTESELRKAVNENKKIFMAYKNRLVPFIEMTSYISYPNTATFSCADFGQTDLINNKIGLTKTTLEISFSDSSVSEDIESLNLQLTV